MERTDFRGVMVPHKLDDYDHKLKYPVMVQRKLDGIRCIAHFDEYGNVSLYSKRMKPFVHLDHIKTALKRWKLKNVYLDGELYSHGLTLHQISSIVMKKRNLTEEERKESEKIVYMIFDIIDYQKRFQERYAHLQSLFQKKEKDRTKNKMNHIIQLVECDIAKNRDEIDILNNQYLMEKYEGVIVRNMDGLYVPKRSFDVLRTKEFKHGIFTILSGKSGVGTHKDTLIWELKCNRNNSAKSFYAIQLGTLPERRSLYTLYKKDPSQFIGKRVKVKYLSIDDYGCVIRNPIVEHFLE